MLVSVPIFLSDSVVDTKVEIQIRTIAMDFWASLEHQLRYKKEKELSPQVHQELKACAEASAILDKRMQLLFDEISKPE